MRISDWSSDVCSSDLQAAACGLPLLEAGIPAACDNDTYEAAMAGALAEPESRWPGLHTAAFGDLLLEDIRAWRQAQCARVGWELGRASCRERGGQEVEISVVPV